MTSPPPLASASPLRVLYCIDAMVHGGTEKQLAALIAGLDRTRVLPALCTLKPSTIDLAPLDCPAIEVGFRSFRSPDALRAIRRLRRFILERRIDVIQTYFQDSTLLACLSSLRTPVRARIATFRDMGFWRTPAKVAQLRLAYPAFDGFIANAPAVAQRVHEADRIPLEKIEVIPNGVVMGPCPPQSRAATRPVVGIVANLDRPVKRVDLFLDAARQVRDAVGDVEFVIVGDGHLRPDLVEQARRCGISAAVRFAGSVADARAEIRRFSVGVIASDSEGLSNAILEYMAEGVPAVARAVGGNADAILDGETGRLVDGADPRALSDAIVGLLRNDARRRHMGARARAIADARFSMGACVRRHEAYYERIVSRAPATARLAWSAR